MRLRIHQAGNVGFIGRLQLSEEDQTKLWSATSSRRYDKNKPLVIFIVDRSESMGEHVERLTSVVLPRVARRYFGLQTDDTYTLVTFDDFTETFTNNTVAEWEERSITLRCRGCTYMAEVFQHLTDKIKTDDNPNVRIVAVSDGAVWDTDETLQAASVAASTLKFSKSISATAIRLFTSASQPDTRALASVLQLNTFHGGGSIVDIQASTTPEELEAMVDTIGTAICESACAGQLLTLKAENPCFLQVPWAHASSEIHIHVDKEKHTTTVWLASRPVSVTLNGEPVEVDDFGERITHDTLHILLADKIDYFMNQLRVLKVLNCATAREELARIVTFVQELEGSLPPQPDISPLLADNSLAGRATYMKTSLARRLKSITTTMQSIVNDDRIALLNQAQQADYLRQVGYSSSRNAKALARRAEESGMDFNATVRAEILTMAAHFQEIEDVDDSEHAISFFSSATTLEGIRHMVELAKEPDLLQNLTAAELLRLFNIVGIPAIAPVGDFPDPMTYRVEKFLYGTYVSVADITMALHKGGSLTAPGHKEQIRTAIPFFENPRLQKFLQMYARSCLEYLTSIGMRRIIAEVPKTYPYTVCAGVWKMVEELDRYGKSEVRVKNFQHLVTTYEGYFELYKVFSDHILPLLVTNQDPSLSYNLGYNGIINLIAPIIYKIRHRETLFMPRILRAIFSFESYRAMRRVIGTNVDEPSNLNKSRQEVLDKILGIDFGSDRATPLPTIFTRAVPNHCREAVINREVLKEYTKHLWFVPYATLLEPLISALVHSENPIEAVQAIESMSTESITRCLELPTGMTLDDFMLYNVVEGLLCTCKASRVDKETDLPKLGDLGNPGEGKSMIEKYIASRYENDYKQRLKVMYEEEQTILLDELFDVMVKTEDMSEFASCISEGKQRGPVKVLMNGPASRRFGILHKRLMDSKVDVPKRADKLYLIYSGRPLDSDDKIFNGGNLYLTCDWNPLHSLLEAQNKIDIWDQLQHEFRTRGHSYRGGHGFENRHGHSNDFKSYFAFGCKTLTEYKDMISEQEWSQYTKLHARCCGVEWYLAEAGAKTFRHIDSVKH